MAKKKSAKSEKTEYISYRTCWFTARFPKLNKPDTEGQYADGKFKTDGVLDDEAWEKTEKDLRAAAKKLWPDVPVDEIHLPMKSFYKNKEAKEKGEADGRGIVLKSKRRPAVFDSKKKPLPAGVNIGAGSLLRSAATIAPYSKTEKVKVKDPKTGKFVIEEGTEYGITLYLGPIQVKKLVERQGNDASAFDEEDGFEFDGEDDSASDFDDASDL